ncbi:hypothetical protein DMUE_5396, partial [Dictyocoela muelleri]
IRSYGCLFHYGQCIWRKIQNLGLSINYKNNIHNNKTIFKYFLNLPYIKTSRVQEGFEYIKTSILNSGTSSTFNNFLEYYERTFYGNQDSHPFFNVECWSVFSRIKQNIPTTINSIEGWHRGFNRLVGIRNPNFGRFIDALRQETEKIRSNLARYSTGNFEITSSNFIKKEKLKIYAENEKFMNIKDIFSFLNNINERSFEE